MKKIELTINGIKCEGCITRIKNVLADIKGLDSYDISLENKKLTLSVKKEKTIEEVIEKINGLGFEVVK